MSCQASSDDKSFDLPHQGSIEFFDGHIISGWHFNSSDESQILSIYLDEELLCGLTASLPRADIDGRYSGAVENCGFHADLSHFKVLERCKNTVELKHRLQIVSASRIRLTHDYNDPFLTPARQQYTGETEARGQLDGIEDGVVTGWVAIYGQVERLLLHVFADGVFLGEAIANLYREDIGKLYHDFYSGFKFSLPLHLYDGRGHKVSCVLALTGKEITNSPKVAHLPLKTVSENSKIRNMVELSDKLERELKELRGEVSKIAFTGNACMANYQFYQEIVQLSRATKARLSKVNHRRSCAISIIMPTYKSDLLLVEKAIDSVVSQTDTDWELVISNSASCSGALQDYLLLRADNDDRIKVVLNTALLGISDNMNVGIRAARGDYIGFLDHDDELAPETLTLVREALSTGAYDLVYSDEDKIDLNGRFVEPHYKSAFNYDLLLSMNYICHFVCVRKDVLLGTELLRRQYDGAQDWDLLLRLTEIIDHSRFGHIPRVLYHWRMVKGSTSLALSEKSYALDAGKEAVSAHLEAIGASASVKLSRYGIPYMDVRWRPRLSDNLVSIIIPTKDRLELVTNCINSLQKTIGDVKYEIIIVDNDSSRASTLAFDQLRQDSRIRVIRFNGAFNYSAINNFAVTQARGLHVLLLNNDVFFYESGWLEDMLGVAQRPGVGVVGLKLLFPDNRVQHCGVVLGNGGVAGHQFMYVASSDHGYFARACVSQEVSAVTGACLLVSKKLYLEIGGLDEVNLKVAFNDVDFCLKVSKQGYRVIFVATTYAYHAESVSRGYEDSPEKIKRFQSEIATMKNRWGNMLTQDRFYSPNFDLDHPCYQIIDLEFIASQENQIGNKILVR